MTIIKGGHLELRTLEKENIETLRLWRNSPQIKSNMLFQNHISASDQVKWYHSLDNTQHYYELYYKMEFIGVLNVKNIDWKLKVGEAGIIIGNNNFLKSPIPILAIVMMMNYYFNVLYFKKLIIKVIKSNNEALQLNIKLGYLIEKEFENYFLLSINSIEHEKHNKRFNKIIYQSIS